MRLRTNISHCDECDAYHLNAEHPEKEVPPSSILILQCLAQGYRDAETAKIVSLTVRSVEGKVTNMMKRFAALSRPNLIAITISLGILDPNSFVPHQEERIHA